jgi:hypothetical protein
MNKRVEARCSDLRPSDGRSCSTWYASKHTRHFVPVAVLVFMTLGTNRAAHAQLSEPIPTPITKRGLRVELKDVARLPDTRGLAALE